MKKPRYLDLKGEKIFYGKIQAYGSCESKINPAVIEYYIEQPNGTRQLVSAETLERIKEHLS